MDELGDGGAMSGDRADTSDTNVPPWRSALDDLERSLAEAGRAIAELRRGLEGTDAPAPDAEAPAAPTVLPTDATREAGEAGLGSVAKAQDAGGLAAFERVWERIESERLEQRAEGAAEPSSAPRGLDLLLKEYLMTVEDRESSVDLIPLHRALLTLADMDNIRLVSFANHVPVISVRTQGEIDLDRLRDAIAAATDRQCEVIPQDTGKLFLRLTPQEDEGV